MRTWLAACGVATLALVGTAQAQAEPAAGSLAWLLGIIGGLVQLLLSILFALLVITYGVHIVARLIKGIELSEEMQKKNLGVAALFAGVVVAFATVLASGISYLSQAIAKLGGGLADPQAWAAVGMALVAVLIGFVVAVLGIIWAYGVLKRMLSRIAGFDVEASLKEGNTALGLLLGAAIFAIATMLATGVSGVSKALIGV